MNKKVITIGCLSLAILMGGTVFTSCSNDDEPAVVYPVEKDLAGNYLGNLKVNVGGETDYPNSKVTVSKGSADNTISLGIKDFSFGSINIGDINLENLPLTQTGEGNYSFKGTPSVQVKGVSTPVTTSGTISSNKLTVNLNITFGGKTVTVNFDGNKLTGSESSEAKILTFTFDQSNADNSVVLIQPEIKDNTITFSVDENATDEQLKKLVPTITVSDGAVVTPANGVAQDFTQPVTYTVTAADGTQVKYTVTTNKNASATSYDFEKWVAGVDGQEPDMTFYNPQGWTSSNAGAQFLKGMQYASSYVVTEDKTDAHNGSAVKIQTIDSKGGDMIITKVPRVTTGTLFLGNFLIDDLTNTLKSTKFGIPYQFTDKYPVQLKGWYKYEAGKDYYTCKAPYLSNCHLATVDASQKDKGNITVVLYETPAYDTEEWTDCLTGAEGDNNIKTSSRIAAIGTMDVEDQASWKEFTLDIKFVNGKSFDATKKYRLAINCSSSYQGDKFWGAPGSTLWVDDFELIYQNVK